MAVAGAWVDWGLPGTQAYATYELLNRLAGVPDLLLPAAPLALLMSGVLRGSRLGGAGAIGLLVGLVAMLVGSVAEFWLFSTAPYSGPGSLGRLLSFFVGYFLGGVLALLSMATIGIWGLQSRSVPMWMSATLLALPAAFIVLAVSATLPYATLPAGVALIALGLLARRVPETRGPALARQDSLGANPRGDR
jgi:hypothetical protein